MSKPFLGKMERKGTAIYWFVELPVELPKSTGKISFLVDTGTQRTVSFND